ncbi:serine/threonine-protein kinase, partial [Corallococcus llansteffanensis]
MKTRRIPDTGSHRALTEQEMPALAPLDPLVSAQLGEFVIQERIGAGGMGVVYRAVHPLIGKQAAIKVLRAELMSPEQEQRLLVEARAVNAIRHPGILDIFNFGTLPDGRPYVVMELLQGRPLADVLHVQGRLDVAMTVWMLDQMLSALGAAHRAGVVHRDLKPANVFMVELPDAAPTLKLVDFGIAKVLQSNAGLTRTDGSVLGTPDFMAPEQIRGGTIGPATDLYAVGVLAFQMLTGVRPFQGENVQVMFAHVEQAPPRPSSKVEGIPPALDALVLQLLEKDPARRPASAEAVRQQLQTLSQELLLKKPTGTTGLRTAMKPEGEAPTSPSAVRVPGFLTVRRKAAPLVLGAVAALVLLGVGFGWLNREREATPVLDQRRPMPVAPVLPTRPPDVAPPKATEGTSPVTAGDQDRPTGATPTVVAEDDADTTSGSEVKASGLAALPLGSPSEKRLARRLAGLFKQLRARAKDVDAEGELRGKLVQQYRAAADATTEPERARIHLGLDAWEKVLAERIARHDAPPPPVVQPVVAPR